MRIPLIAASMLLPFILQGCKSAGEKDQARPNIIFIMSDDHAYQAISAYSDQLIRTPGIDRIAGEGMLFTNACVTNSICAPSRAVILTGKHSHINGKIDNRF
ncbi:MAG: sulfatase, partial [Bacteroidetes bacterium]